MKSCLRGFRQGMAVLLCAALTATGCATAGGARVSRTPAESRQFVDPAVLVEYAQKLPPGTTLRVQRASRPTIEER
jgi:hypothetical protein